MLPLALLLAIGSPELAVCAQMVPTLDFAKITPENARPGRVRVRLIVATLGDHTGVEAEPGDSPVVRSVLFSSRDGFDPMDLNPGDKLVAIRLTHTVQRCCRIAGAPHGRKPGRAHCCWQTLPAPLFHAADLDAIFWSCASRIPTTDRISQSSEQSPRGRKPVLPVLPQI
jgi:hypothetical protein